MSFRDTIRRTECGCEMCAVGCLSLPGMLAVGDLEKIADYCEAQWHRMWGNNEFNRSQWVATHFVASEGAKVGKFNDRGTVDLFEIKTITPAQQPNGECVFYRAGKCSIHPVSPLGCAMVDSHMSKAEGDAVVHPALAEIFEDQQAGGSYSRNWAALNAAGRVASPRAERRARFEALYAQAARKAARMAPVRPDSPLEA